MSEIDKHAREARVLELFNKGAGRNEIARLSGVSKGVVSRIIKEHNLEFVTDGTAAATQARVEKAQLKAAMMLEEAMDDALALRMRLWEPVTYYFPTAEGELQEVTEDLPNPTDTKQLMSAVEASVRVVERVSAILPQKASANTTSIMGEAMAALGMLVQKDREETGGIR